ncbi:hydroxyethylthiazole kinase [Pseudooceanicola sp. CBS1P-1]|uniref:Hydroxyethylthiazole kinase n=1 Tax=Pseudooceanicola albus TaxID=2692189 RepID=A0A6L7G702_9RHOB|nr:MULTISPECIES: hydroxyethylthiazole kinase [Pseudooceanicola]MBT9382988.1 hydroxyethylthiazole kinase [Pseudooceanicola endophyticus]MXN19176.1 hydroxyethylthiazole kinase [Pseudooceanicola albus]
MTELTETRLSETLAHMRATAPLVQNITNFVAMNIQANVMLAAGASPAMVHSSAEAAEFAGIAQALSINIGTADPAWSGAMEAAATASVAGGKPWVLDPVAVGATGFRRTLGARLLALRPSVIRGNASEVLALAGQLRAGRGADAADSVAEAEAAATRLALQAGCTVAVTGPVDFVTDGHRAARIRNGHPMMPRVTALGCALTGLVAAFTVDQDPFRATLGALAYYGLAGEVAGRSAEGPGSFQVAFLDALHALGPNDLTAGARIEEIPA